MTSGNGESQRFEFSAFGVTVRLPSKRALEIIATASLLVSGALALGLWQHRTEANENSREVKEAIKEANTATVGALTDQSERQLNLLRAILSESREQTCLQRFDPKDRKDQEDFCRRLSGKSTGRGER